MQTTTERPESQYEEGISKAEAKRREKANAIFQLREMLKPGDKVQTILRYVSRSGMSRSISILCAGVQRLDLFFYHPNYAVACLTGRRLKRGGMNDAIISIGCGFDHLESIARDIEQALGYKADGLKYEYL